jgi:hypothetical protein
LRHGLLPPDYQAIKIGFGFGEERANPRLLDDLGFDLAVATAEGAGRAGCEGRAVRQSLVRKPAPRIEGRSVHPVNGFPEEARPLWVAKMLPRAKLTASI